MSNFNFSNNSISPNKGCTGLSLCVLLVCCTLFAGCTIVAPGYRGSVGNIDKLKAAHLGGVVIGSITKDSASKSDVDQLTIRGSTYSSPYGSFTAYFQEALTQEFRDAGLRDAASKVEVSGVLIRNELDGSGISLGFAEIEARLTVRRSGVVAFEATKATRIEWPSNFIGAVAIPRAAQSYPLVVQKLLAEFYSDAAFTDALKLGP